MVCTWGHWGPYSQCSKNCGGGQKSRTRAPTGGTSCPGARTQSNACNAQACQKPKRNCLFGILGKCLIG